MRRVDTCEIEFCKHILAGSLISPTAEVIHLQELIENHATAVDEMRAFFKGMIDAKQEAIEKLKDNITEAIQCKIAAESHASRIDQENKRLVDPLAAVRCVKLLLNKTFSSSFL